MNKKYKNENYSGECLLELFLRRSRQRKAALTEAGFCDIIFAGNNVFHKSDKKEIVLYLF